MQNAQMKSVELPEPGYPMLTRMVSHALFAENGKENPVTWVVTKPHPLVPEMRVVRMFVDRGGVEIYSVSADGANGMRNLIPMTQIRLIEEAMPLDVFIDELAAAEDDEDEDADDPDDATGDTAPAPAPSNGQATP
jgi:hypothetical protein